MIYRNICIVMYRVKHSNYVLIFAIKKMPLKLIKKLVFHDQKKPALGHNRSKVHNTAVRFVETPGGSGDIHSQKWISLCPSRTSDSAKKKVQQSCVCQTIQNLHETCITCFPPL